MTKKCFGALLQSGRYLFFIKGLGGTLEVLFFGMEIDTGKYGKYCLYPGKRSGGTSVNGKKFGNPWILLVVFPTLLAACGGGGSESPTSQAPPTPTGPVSVLSWTPPASYSDNAVMDPLRDLDHYELYVRQDPNFTDTDSPVAIIAAVTDAASGGGGSTTRVPEREFILENVQAFITPGNRHYVSMKAVGIDGQKSGFMAPVLWDRS